MNCPSCQAPNPEGARFCSRCGAALTPPSCPDCGAPLAPAARFCSNCGFQVASKATPAPSPTGRLGDLLRSATSAVQETIRSVRTRVEGERKQVTLLFTDIVGSTALAEQLDPEDWAEIVAGAHQRVSTAVAHYDGTIAQLLGDGVLAFFGAPVTHEDDPVRAVAAALDILAATSAYAAELRTHRRVATFQMRVGLNTGLVVVGNVGSAMHMEYLAVGDSVNLAARLQAAAQPDTVLISAGTARRVRHAFDLEPCGPFDLKGKSEPVPAFRVLGRKAEPTSARGLEGLRSPLVGRERELQLLQARIGELTHGRGQLVSVMGEAGLGKSRLVAEARGWVRQGAGAAEGVLGPAQWLEGRSLSYEVATPYAPFGYLLGSLFGLRAEAPATDAERYDRICAQVAAVLPGRVGEIAPFLATLLGLQLVGEELERVRYLDPPNLRARIFQATADLCEQLARSAPLVLVFEDLHWADPLSLDLLEHLMTLTERAPVMLLAVFRAQAEEPSWRFHEVAARNYAHRYTAVTLEPLDQSSARTLVANLLHIEDLPERVRALILSKAEGNPFFVEEVIRSLLDGGLVVRDNGHWRATREIEQIAVPDTLAGVIGARLDQLEAEAKQVAQTAAVIGREFAFDPLADVYEARPLLGEALADLRRRELIRELHGQPDLSYLFKHALTQEAAYASLLLSRRRVLHRRVAEYFERVDPERANDISRHLLEAQEEARAAPYLVTAGDRAAHAYATPVAIGFYRRALEILQTVEDLPLTRRAYEGLGEALMLANDMAAAVENYQAMLRFAQERGDIPMQVSALNKMANALIWVGRFPEVERNLIEAERLARGHEDRPGLAELYWVRCGICTMTADFGGAARYLGEAIQIGREMNVPAQLSYGLSHMANTQGYMARFDEMWQTAQEGLRLARETGELKHQSELLGFPIALYHLRSGDVAAAHAAAQEGLGIAERIGAVFPETISAFMLGGIAQARGEYDRAIADYEHALRAGQASGFVMLEAVALGGLGSVYGEIGGGYRAQALTYHQQALAILEQPAGMPSGGTAWADIAFCALAEGDLERAQEYFQKGLTMPTIMGLLNRPRFLIGAALVALQRGQIDEAAEHVAEARIFAEDRSMRQFYPLIAYAEGNLRTARGEAEAALAEYARAEALALDLGMRPLVWPVRLAAAAALTALGRAAEAGDKRQAARAMIDEIAGLIEDTARRALFLEGALAKVDGPAAGETP